MSYAQSKALKKSEPLTKTSANPKTQPKAQPKSAVATKVTAKGPKVGKPKKTKNAKPKAKPKTVDELDAEMADYFVGGNNTAGASTAAAPNGATQPAAAGEDLGMDEISVSSFDMIT